MLGKCIIVMGVSGSGKSSVGAGIAEALHAKFIDGDDLHPKANIDKMALGEPLNDSDRSPWLERIRDAVYSLNQKHEQGVIVCSSLKKSYRDQIRNGNTNLVFVYLDGDFDLIRHRMAARQGHFMKESMLRSQFDALECPTSEKDVIHITIDQPLEDIVRHAAQAITDFDHHDHPTREATG
ncbi:gluconokinase [Thaumasiovibrio subtropicus]|uniref:gluconokinase n=1 Tax=Thaumasiovibrio subtropicus TaxID=1891207 RepID=UPI000B34F270|nr:gluconokinase [Thaumasiovibrio subtropicus]